MILRSLVLLCVCLATSFAFGSSTHSTAKAPKPFRRAVIFGGGGLTPAAHLGVLAALRDSGWKPDLLITSCGSSFAAMVGGAYPEKQDQLRFLRSRELFDLLHSLVAVKTSSVFGALKVLHSVNDTSVIPDIFNQTLLWFSQEVPWENAPKNFQVGDSKLIIMGSQILFTPKDVGTPRGTRKTYREVVFTDRDTARLIPFTESPIAKQYPKSFVARDLRIISDIAPIVASRAAVADPFLGEPLERNGEYLSTGALDLYPLEIAESLADEVLSVYPQHFAGLEQDVFMNSFGFDLNQRGIDVINGAPANVYWYDNVGLDAYSMNPRRSFLSIIKGVPTDFQEYVSLIDRQWSFGYSRGNEALAAIRNQRASRTEHLRIPLKGSMTSFDFCRKAVVWKTNENLYCEQDYWKGCDRKTVRSCTFVR